MDIVILKGVKAHELRGLFQALQFSMEPASILVEPVDPMPEACGQRPEVKRQGIESSGSRSESSCERTVDCGGGGGDHRPVNVSVSVVTTNGAGTAPGVDNPAARKEPATPDDSAARENEVLRGENEELKGNVVGMLAAVATKVEAEYFRYILAVMAAGSVLGAAQALGMANSTLACRLKAFAARGETYRRLYDLMVVRQKLGVRSFERFNEEFAKHQPEELREESVLQSVLEGLENLHGGNWESAKKELMEMVQTAGL